MLEKQIDTNWHIYPYIFLHNIRITCDLKCRLMQHRYSVVRKRNRAKRKSELLG